MPSRAPAITLALLLAAAVMVLVGGAWLARKTEQVRMARDRTPLHDFASTLGVELERLERHYEGHLRRIARDAKPSNAFETRELCDEVVGIRQLSLIGIRETPGADVHIPLTSTYQNLIAPTLGRQAGGLPRHEVLLDANTLMEGPDTWGWVDEPARPLMFWQRTGKSAVVLLIDRREIAAAIDRWLVNWSRSEFSTVRAAGGPDQLLGSASTALAVAGQPGGEPGFLQPLRGRFGTWQIASWDRFETRVQFHQATLTAATGLAVLVALLGVVMFAQQRRALALAGQRVSFVNSVSHELRTPLTNILLNLDLASEQIEDAVPARRLSLVREEAGRLSRLIENVLTFSRREQGKLELRAHACQPGLVIDAVLAQFAPGFARRAITVRHEGRVTGECVLDADALSQIAANLLSNVEKYAPGCAVTITVRHEAGEFVLHVADEGPGIPAHAAERVFTPFERLDHRVTEGTSGTGLGLAIARELATRMGGTLRLLPSQKGAAFELRVPAPPVASLKAC